MRREIGTFAGLQGVRLCMQSWKPERDIETRAAVIILHGGDNHCDLPYINRLAEALVDAGYAAYSYDQRGFGRSEGEFMHLDSWLDVRGDLAAFIRYVRIKEPQKKIFLFGASFGSCQAVDQMLVSSDLISGVIACAFSTVPLDVSGVIRKFLNIFGKHAPRKKLPHPSEKAYPDPLIPRSMTFGFLYHLTKRQQELRNELKNITMPVLLQQGAKDQSAKPTSEIGELIGSKDFTRKVYSNSGHEILEGPDAEEAIMDIIKWIDMRLV